MLLGKYREKCEECTLKFMIEKCDYNKVQECEERVKQATLNRATASELEKYKQELLEAIQEFERKRFMYEDEWDGISEDSHCIECEKTFRENSIRRKVWLALLRIKQVDLDHYLTLVKLGSQAEGYESILLDVERTIGFFPVSLKLETNY